MATQPTVAEQKSGMEQPTSPLVDIASECVGIDQFDSRDGFENWMAAVDVVRDQLERIAEETDA
jgi:hypothetical protein